MKDDKVYLTHIKESIDKIFNYTEGGYDVFKTDGLIQDAVIRNFEIVGEATKNLSTNFRQAHGEIPWRQIAGLRDVMIHDYMGVDIDEVWNVVENHLPSLKSAIEELL